MVLPGSIFFLFSRYSRGFISRCHRPGICSPSSGAQMPSKVPRSSVTECSIAGTGDGEGSMVGSPKKGWCTKGRNDENLDDFLGNSNLWSCSYWIILGWGCRIEVLLKIRLELDRLPRRNVKNGSHWIEFWGSVRWLAMWVKQIYENHPPVITIR